MERFSRFRWNNRPLLVRCDERGGLDAWTPDKQLFTYQTIPFGTAQELAQTSLCQSGGGDRALPRPLCPSREEVERLIAQLNGWELPNAENSDDPMVRLRARLRSVGSVASRRKPCFRCFPFA